jgi:translation initiation factor 2 subunit 2
MNNYPIEPSNMIRLDSIDSFKIINPNIDDTQDVENYNSNSNYNYNNDPDTIHDTILDQSINIDMEPEQIYIQLLDEIYETISDNNQIFGNSNANISKPDIKYENRKTFWYNYGKNCSQINRSTFQLKNFFEKELAVESSINDKSNLILRGKYNFNLIASTFKKYIKNYVQCSTCKSVQTEIVRNSSNRLDYLKCLNPKCNTCKVVIKI